MQTFPLSQIQVAEGLFHTQSPRLVAKSCKGTFSHIQFGAPSAFPLYLDKHSQTLFSYRETEMHNMIGNKKLTLHIALFKAMVKYFSSELELQDFFLTANMYKISKIVKHSSILQLISGKLCLSKCWRLLWDKIYALVQSGTQNNRSALECVSVVYPKILTAHSKQYTLQQFYTTCTLQIIDDTSEGMNLTYCQVYGLRP